MKTVFITAYIVTFAAYLQQCWAARKARKTNAILTENNELLKQSNILLRDSNADAMHQVYRSNIAVAAAHRQLNALGQVPVNIDWSSDQTAEMTISDGSDEWAEVIEEA